MAGARITIRLSATLAARLAATTGPHRTLADTVRHALEAYLDGDHAQRQPPGSHPADAADTVADTLAAITTRLTHLEQRLTVLEATAARASYRQPARQPRFPSAAAATAPPYDESRYVLGKLCPQAHEYGTTGLTLRRRHNQACPACASEWQRERRRQRREGEGA